MRRLWQGFRRDETGAITPLMLILFIGILLTTGVSMDMLRHEAERADLQAALDRGVLAAAGLSQRDSQTVVADYVRKGIAAGTVASLTVNPSGGASGRVIQASAAHGMETSFLSMVGLDRLNVAAAAGATQARNVIEISLVLDISGSMRETSIDGEMNKLENLRIAARDFIDEVTDEGTNTLTTINLVRYAGQLNPGPTMFEMLGGQRSHDKSSCFELTDADFQGTGLPEARPRVQVPNFHHWYRDTTWMDWGWCPSDGEAIVYASSDAAVLKQEIDSIRLHDGTGTYNAMKWGMALLDPTSQPAFAALAASGEIAPENADRPRAWNDPDTQKILVLMTDGKITEQYRPDNPADPALATEEVLVYGHPYTQVLTREKGVEYFQNLCTLARANGVRVFTIAFEVLPEYRHEMEGCATSPADFWYVEGREIEAAFKGISSRIESLKLVN